ncbi:hypothetical protein [Hymenobacter ruricola]|uniref:hypothetical protein n=1 Tax=Hymenobacter ruricola TaxID=2791023 RepID=UPI0018AF8D48|nr:hypothetical protein [Hymenobacter ruricola]
MITTLAGRVAYLCSNPFCRRVTIGPHTATDKTTLIGVAAHITAASPGGPRYDPSLSDIERKSIGNGIWLCSNCATLIDKDEKHFPVSHLKDWRNKTEAYAAQQLGNGQPLLTLRPKIEAILLYQNGISSNEGFAEYISPGSLIRIEEAKLIISAKRHYKLQLINNSSIAAINIRLQQTGSNHLILDESIPSVNNLGPFLERNIKCTLSNFYIMTGGERVTSQRAEMAYPEELSDLQLAIDYTNEHGQQFQTLTSFSGKQPNNIFH